MPCSVSHRCLMGTFPISDIVDGVKPTNDDKRRHGSHNTGDDLYMGDYRRHVSALLRYAYRSHNQLTEVAINIKPEVRIVRPYDGIDAIGEILPKQPKTQERDAKIPALPNKTGQKNKQESGRRQDANNGIEREGRIDRTKHGSGM